MAANKILYIRIIVIHIVIDFLEQISLKVLSSSRKIGNYLDVQFKNQMMTSIFYAHYCPSGKIVIPIALRILYYLKYEI